MNLLGSGPTGSVVLSRDRTTGTVVAIKYLSKTVYQSPGFADLFRYEAARLVHIDNPHLGLIYEYVEGSDSAAVVMEFIDGVSLRALLAGDEALDPQPALYVFKGILLGLTDLHGKGIAHGDLRPENVMVDSNSVTKVVDVGISASAGRKSPLAGDPRYRAPEMWSGEKPSPTSDVYAATATLYECLTGKPPLASDGEPLGHGELVDAEQILAIQPASMPDPIRRLMTMGLASRPDGRAPDAAAMLAELELAARAYGPGWEKAGKAKLDYRLAALRSSRRAAAAAAPPEAPVSRITWTRTLVAVSAVVVLLLGGVAYATGLFSGPNNASASAPVPVFTHTPVPTTGPTVPPPPTSLTGDTTKPQQVVGLHLLGRSQTAVTLEWNPSRDNIRVIGYIINRNGVKVGTSYLNGYTDVGLRAGTTYDYTVVAFDAAGNRSVVSTTILADTLHAPDRLPPSVPTNLHSPSRSKTTVVLAWAPSHDNVGVAGYDVFRNGRLLTSVITAGFTDRGLQAGTTYRYSVRAFDTSNNASSISGSIAVTTLKKEDKTKPTAPTHLVATGTSVSTIGLTWSASTDNIGVAGYRVYRGTTPLTTVPGTSYSDYGLSASTSYTYTVVAVDAAGNPSNPSNTATGRTQDPIVITPPPPTPSAAPSTAAPPPPPATVTGVTLTHTDISSDTGCTTRIDATVTATGGSVAVSLDYTVDGDAGANSPVSATVPDTGSVTVTLQDDVDGTADGSAHVSVDGQSDTTSWTAPSDCVPATTPPSPPPTTDPPTQDPTVPPSDPGSPDVD